MKLKRSVQVTILTSVVALFAALALPAVADKPEPVDFPEAIVKTIELATNTSWQTNGTAVACTHSAYADPATTGLSPAQWIFGNNCNEANSTYTFSQTFDIPVQASVLDASLVLGADNWAWVYVNGHEVGAALVGYPNNPGGAYNFRATDLVTADSETVKAAFDSTTDSNEVALVVQNASGPGAGIAKLSVTYQYFAAPTAIEHCNDGNWALFADPSFVHQGDCVSWVATNEKNEPGIGNGEHPDDVDGGDGDDDDEGHEGGGNSEADACESGGWATFTDPSFRNQGDCVSYFATDGENPAVVDGDDSANSDRGADEDSGNGDGDGDGGGDDKGHDATHEDNGIEDNGHEEGHDDQGQSAGSDEEGASDGDDQDGDADGHTADSGHDATHVDNGTEDNGHEEGHDDEGQGPDGGDEGGDEIQ